MKKKFASLFLVMALVLTMIPASAFAGTGDTLVVKASAADTYTFVQGEPIMVKATSSDTNKWYGLYNKGDSGNSYWWWQYVGNDYVNIYENKENYYTTYDGSFLAPGEYDIAMSDGSLRQTIEIVAPTDTTVTDLEVKSENVTSGEPVSVKATSYTTGAWVGVYYNKVFDMDTDYSSNASDEFYYVATSRGAWKDFYLAAGEYTFTLFQDSGYTAVECINVTVEGSTAPEETGLFTTEKDTYAYGEQITVKTAYDAKSPAWVGIYKKGDNPNASGMTSLHWVNVTGEGTEVDINHHNFTNDGNSGNNTVNPLNRPGFYIGDTYKLRPGEYTIHIFPDGSYSSAYAKDITISETEVVVEPTCDADGYTMVYTVDGNDYVKEGSTVEGGHQYSATWTYNEATGTHSRACGRDASHVETGYCDFTGEPVDTKAPNATTGEAGYNKYQCPTCKGIKTVEVPADVHLRTETKEATCTEAGYVREWYKNAEGEEYFVETETKPALTHAWSKWEPIGETLTQHKRVCGNDASHVETDSCTPTESFVGNKVVNTCSECGDSTSKVVISTDKAIYAPGEDVIVKTNFPTGNNNWLGIFYMEDGEEYPHAPAKGWFYLTADSMEVNLLEKGIYTGGGADGWTDFINPETGELLAGTWTVAIILDDQTAGGQVVPLTRFTICEHAYDRETVVKEPTCYEPGLKEVMCHRCFDVIEETIPTLEHDWDNGVVTKNPTCTETGVKTFTCQVEKCGATDTESIAVNKDAHPAASIKDLPAKAATCKETGLTAGKKCEKCGVETVKQTETPKLTTHSWDEGKMTVADTCTAEGKKTFVCGVCKTTRTETVDVVKGHAFGTPVTTKAPTCTSGGQTVAKCTRPGCTEQQVAAVGKLPHNYVTVPGVAATCTTEGKTDGKACSVCGTVSVAQGVIEKLPHTVAASTVTKKATAKANGVITNTCACGEVVSTDVIAKPVVSLSKAGVVYTGKKVKAPVVRVKAGGKTVATANYTITKPKNVTKMKDIGRYVYTVKFKGDKYSGSVKVNFEIKPAKTKIKAPAAAKKAITVKWTKAAKKEKVTGYEVMYATNSKFTKGKKTVTVKGASKTSKKVTKLKSKTKYYVKVRTYKTVKGKKIYSDWSSVKSIKAK